MVLTHDQCPMVLTKRQCKTLQENPLTKRQCQAVTWMSRMAMVLTILQMALTILQVVLTILQKWY